MTPKKGETKLIHEFILHVICAGNAEDYPHWLNSSPGRCRTSAPQARSSSSYSVSSSRSVRERSLNIYFFRSLADAGHVTTRLKSIVGDFNSVLHGKAFVGIDEALFVGDRQAADQIKGLVATGQIPINEKFLPEITCPAGLNLWILSNSETPVHVEVEDFRYWPLRVSAAKKGDVEYWHALRHEIDNGGR